MRKIQTFLPFESFSISASVLDRKRLGKQRVEALQIFTHLVDEIKNNEERDINLDGWGHHPVFNMWRGYEVHLYLYGTAIINQWKFYGYKDNCQNKFDKTLISLFDKKEIHDKKSGKISPVPIWLGNEEFHRSHRSNLLRKKFDHYIQYFDEPTNLPYVWP